MELASLFRICRIRILWFTKIRISNKKKPFEIKNKDKIQGLNLFLVFFIPLFFWGGSYFPHQSICHNYNNQSFFLSIYNKVKIRSNLRSLVKINESLKLIDSIYFENFLFLCNFMTSYFYELIYKSPIYLPLLTQSTKAWNILSE